MPALEVSVISTGIAALDKTLSGRSKAKSGFPVGRISLIRGGPKSGTSAICISAVPAALEVGEVVYFDYGGDALERMEVDDNLTVHTNYGVGHPSALLAGIEQAIRDGVRLVIVDSIDRIIQPGDRHMFGVKKLHDRVQGSATALVFADRYPSWPDESWHLLLYSSSVTVRVTETIPDESEANVVEVRAKVEKNMIAPSQGRTCGFYLHDGLPSIGKAKKKSGSSLPSRFDREDIV